MKQRYLDVYEFDDAFGRLQFNILENWLSQTYWSPNIKVEEIAKGARNSTLVLGCYREGEQVGYLRLVSDKTRFAYFMDVYVEASHRRKGIAGHMIRFSMAHPDLADVYLWLLATHDAQSVYAQAGFQPLAYPERWMAVRKEKVRE